MKDFIIGLLLFVIVLLVIVFSPWTNAWAARQLEAEDQKCMATGFTKAQCDYIQADF